MELRFPAPSSDEAISLDNSTRATTPVLSQTSPPKGVRESNAVEAVYHQVTDGPMMTSVSPVYRSMNVPTDDNSEVLSVGDDKEASRPANATASVAGVPNSSTPDPSSGQPMPYVSPPHWGRGSPSYGLSGVNGSGSGIYCQLGVCLSWFTS